VKFQHENVLFLSWLDHYGLGMDGNINPKDFSTLFDHVVLDFLDACRGRHCSRRELEAATSVGTADSLTHSFILESLIQNIIENNRVYSAWPKLLVSTFIPSPPGITGVLGPGFCLLIFFDSLPTLSYCSSRSIHLLPT
jgi:hypothetical protein